MTQDGLKDKEEGKGKEASEAILTYFSSLFALDNLEIGHCKEVILVS